MIWDLYARFNEGSSWSGPKHGTLGHLRINETDPYKNLLRTKRLKKEDEENI